MNARCRVISAGDKVKVEGLEAEAIRNCGARSEAAIALSAALVKGE